MNLSPDELYAQFVKVWKEFFRRQKSAHTAHLEPATFSNGVRTVGKPLQKKGVRGQAAITGIGILSPIGSDEPAILSSLREGRHGLAPITKIDMRHFRMKCGGEVADFDASHWLTPEELAEYADPYLHFAIAAARKALDDAGIARAGAKNLDGIALVLATCNGGLRTAEAEYAWKHGLCDTPFSAKANLMAQNYGFGKALAAALGIRGEAWVVNTACSSSTAALGIAQTLISRGWYDTVLVGTSEVLCVSNIAGFEALRATSAQPAAPFSLPVGLNVGEGACFWVVEEMEKALLRNASCKGKIAGHATTCDAYHPTSPDPRGDGVYRTLRDAIENAGLTLDDIGCINAHGTGTEANDRAETRGIARLIGERKIPAVSTKSFFGHCMGAAGMLEATCNLLAMNAGFVPPTVNFSGPRPGCTLDYVPNSARDKQYSAFVSANYAFGGNNAAVVITTRDHEPARKSFERERVVITGTGAITSLGLGAAALVDGLRRGDVGLSSIDTLRLDGMKSRLAGFVPDFKAADVDRRLDFSPLNPISRFAVAAGRLALESAGLRTGPKNAERIGIAMGICNGSSEMEHMDSVFSSGNYAAHINGFSNIVANSTAGWVASALCLKGANITLAPGPHAGLQSLAYAFDALTERRAHAIIAAAADEVYAQTYFNYNLVDYLWPAGDEERYRLRFDDPHRKVIGEGAGVLVMEPLTHANERGSPVLAEVLGYAMTMDGGGFSAPNLNAAALARAIDIALRRSKVTPGEIDLVVWAPQGNAQDRKMLDALRECGGDAWARTPLVATTFNTGYIESASILVSIAAVLESLKSDTALWPQKTGDEGIDNRALCGPPRNLLAIGSSDVGYNYAVVLGMAESGEKDEPQNIE
jgi:3-oxoacyl-[acyl-carrier-protein] synthase II